MKIDVITVGGTIDKVYFDQNSEYQVGEPITSLLFKLYNVGFEFEIHSVMRKDSLDMTEEDREALLDKVLNVDGDKILITHGTDTMPVTAEFLKGKVEGKTVVLTGAILPAGFKNTDAEFNLGCAVGALNICEPGVYIAMNGGIFNAGEVYKDLKARQFKKK